MPSVLGFQVSTRVNSDGKVRLICSIEDRPKRAEDAEGASTEDREGDVVDSSRSGSHSDEDARESVYWRIESARAGR